MKTGRVVFKKENGFPKNFTIETIEFEDPSTEFKGYKSFFRDENEKMIFEFVHTVFRARLDWASGYITALREVEFNKHNK